MGGNIRGIIFVMSSEKQQAYKINNSDESSSVCPIHCLLATSTLTLSLHSVPLTSSSKSDAVSGACGMSLGCQCPAAAAGQLQLAAHSWTALPRTASSTLTAKSPLKQKIEQYSSNPTVS